MQFERIAPYLKEPLVLIGFFLFLAFSFCRYLVKHKVIPPLPPGPGFKILKTILLYGFIIGLLVCALGFLLKYRELQLQDRSQQRVVQAQRDADAAKNAEQIRKNQADLADRQNQEAIAQQRDRDQQRAQVKRLATELNSNLAIANQLRQNTALMIQNFDTLAKVVRTPGVKILPFLFPAKNLDLTIPDDRSINNADDAMDRLGASGLLNDQLEMQKVTAVAAAITQTIQTTMSTVQSLQDPKRVRYAFSDAVWKGDQAYIAKVVVTNLAPYQASYSELELIRANYDVVAQHFVDYLAALQNFFDPTKHLITRNSLRSILATERLTESLLLAYGKSLATDMKSIKALRDSLPSAP